MRESECKRETKETAIEATLRLDGSGTADVATGIGFFDHMLTAWAVHGGFDLTLYCKGDLEVDGHHTVEDAGIVLGTLVASALGAKAGIARYGSFTVPMDESLAVCHLDAGGRPYLVFRAAFQSPAVGGFDTVLVKEFFYAFAVNARVTLHTELLYGENDHHGIEAMFKAFAHALRLAVARTASDGPLSTKGVLE